MLSAELNGRLGNQLFELAHTIGLSKRTGLPFILPEWEHRNSFKRFNNSGKVFSADRESPLLNTIPPFGRMSRRYEQTLGYHELPPPLLNGITYYSGYFQSEKYLTPYETTIKEWFQPVDSIRTRLDSIFSELSPDICSVNVRRGDYLNLPDYHPVLPLEYYQQGAMLVNTDQYLVFSDDIPWCKENLNLPGMIFEDQFNFDSVTAIFAIARCKSHINANSSFSWWGSWLGNSGGKNIFPKTWFGPALPPVTPDRYPPGAIVI